MSEYIGYFFIGMISCVLYLTLLVMVFIRKEPTVRCRDCKYYEDTGNCTFFYLEDGCLGEVTPDGFCAWGERRQP